MTEEILGGDNPAEEDVRPEGSTALTEDQRPEDDQTDDNADDADRDADNTSEDGDADKDKDGAPAELTLTIPEGATVDEGMMTEFKTMLKDVGATSEQGQKFIDMQAALQAQVAEAQVKAWTETTKAWTDAGEQDEEYGKGKYDESIVIARRAMREVGGTDLSKALEETGMGNHPEFIRFFYRVGKVMGEDNLNFGTSASEGRKSQADRMYPNSA